tara:strand:- start:418 stop:1362 length:945 start_codon:yes stop_codon:yes gene_type:complete
MPSVNKKINIITYHYVRNLDSKFLPNLKVLKVNKFKQQIRYLKKNYNILSFEEIKFYIKNKLSFPKNSYWLTFDDGYIDHYKNVFPILKKNKVSASFFPLATKGNRKKLLDVNKIQMILASCTNYEYLMDELKLSIILNQKKFNLPNYSYFKRKYYNSGSFDKNEVAFIKRLLQFVLPEKLRRDLIKNLFNKFIKIDEKKIAKNFYMSEKQIKKLLKSGMHIGGHGIDHIRLSSANNKQQLKEISKTFNFLKHIGVDINDWVMCYPYGEFNEKTKKILKSKGCFMGLTVKRKVANIQKDNFYELPRLDTNDIKF